MKLQVKERVGKPLSKKGGCYLGKREGKCRNRERLVMVILINAWIEVGNQGNVKGEVYYTR